MVERRTIYGQAVDNRRFSRYTHRVKKVSKQEFKDMYFKYGTERDGWGQSYWDQFFEPEPKTPMEYSIEEPASPEHNRMMIVSDVKEYRLFFFTEESEESFFGPETE